MALLIWTNGYQIRTNKCESTIEAKIRMWEEYKEYGGDNLDDSWQSMSYCGDMDSILYNNGKEVYVWQIVEV